jgi:hypothetical protein
MSPVTMGRVSNTGWAFLGLFVLFGGGVGAGIGFGFGGPLGAVVGGILGAIGGIISWLSDILT